MSGAYLGDTTAAVYSGAPVLSSTGAATTATVSGGPYAITAATGTLSAMAGYALALVNTGALTVSPKALSITAANQSATYGTAYTLNTALTTGYTQSGLVNSDTIIGLTEKIPGNLTATTTTTPASTYTITPSAATGTGLSNYTITYNTGTLTVNPATLNTSLTYSVANASSIYGTLAVLGAATLTGILNNDQVSGTVGAFTQGGMSVTLAANTAAGSYVEKVTGLTGAAAANYVIAATGNTNGTLTINPKSLTATVSANNKVYDTTTTATGSVGSLTGIVGGDIVSLTGTAGFAFADMNVGTGKTVTESGLSLTGASAGNYTLATLTGTASITPATLTAGLTGTVSKAYDATTAATLTMANYTLTGILGGDTVTLNDPTSGAYGTKSVGTGKTVSVTGLSISGAGEPATICWPRPAHRHRSARSPRRP